MGIRESPSKNLLIIGCLVTILYATLAPFDFSFPLIAIGFDSRIMKPDAWGDYLRNILLFMPWGFLLGLRIKSLSLTNKIIAVCLVSFLFSSTIEWLQLYLPARTSTITDILTNTGGSLLGVLIALMISRNNLSLSRLQGWNFKNDFLKYTFIAIAVASVISSIWLQSHSSLNNWNPNYHLSIGNEFTADRPWSGTVNYLAISDRFSSSSEVKTILKNPQVNSCQQANDLFNSSLIGCYNFARNKDNNFSNSLPELSRQGINNKQIAGGTITKDSWLTSYSAATILNKRISNSSQFTLVTEIATADIEQGKIARIISLSADESLRNFTLGQQQNNLVIRLRNSITGENGSRPQITIPGIFNNTKAKKIVITYDGAKITVYINKLDSQFDLEFTPATAVFWQFLYLPYLPTVTSWTIEVDRISLKIYPFIYYCLIFISLTLILKAITVRNKLRFRRPYLVALLLLPVILETSLTLTANKQINLSRILLSYLLIGFGSLYQYKIIPGIASRKSLS